MPLLEVLFGVVLVVAVTAVVGVVGGAGDGGCGIWHGNKIQLEKTKV